MFIRWTGNGFFAPVIIGIGLFGVTNITKALYGPSYIARHPFVPWLGLALGGFLCWWIGNSSKDEGARALIDEETGERVVIHKSHTLYGVPMHWWGVIAMVAGLFLAFAGFPFPGSVSRHVSESDSPPTEPVTSFAIDPAGKPGVTPAIDPPARPADKAVTVPVERPAATPIASPAPTPAASLATSTATDPVTNGAPLPASTANLNSAAESPEQMAIRLYPALGVVGSGFNARFLALQKRYTAERPAYFSDPDWPVKLAREVAQGAH